MISDYSFNQAPPGEYDGRIHNVGAAPEGRRQLGKPTRKAVCCPAWPIHSQRWPIRLYNALSTYFINASPARLRRATKARYRHIGVITGLVALYPVSRRSS